MKLRHRPMQPEDIPECVDIVANNPVIGPRYGATIEHLPEAWLRLLQCEAQISAVVHAERGFARSHLLLRASALSCATIFYAR